MKNTKDRVLVLIVAVFIVLGIFLRLKQYSDYRSLWLDEAWISLDIVANSFSALLHRESIFPDLPRPLTGFILSQKLVTLLLGNDEFTLRLIPLFSGILALVLFYRLTRNYLKLGSACIAIGIFAIAQPLINYSVEASKQYSTDVLVTIVLYLLAHRVASKKDSHGSLMLFTLASLLLMWLSYTACFILAAIGLTLVAFFWSKRQWKSVGVVCLCGLLWGENLFFIYKHAVSRLLGNEYLLRTWEFAFLPVNFNGYQLIIWLKNSFLNMFADTLGLAPVMLAGPLFLLGLSIFFKKDKSAFFLFSLPLFFAFILCLLKRFPFHGRQILFLTPILCVGIAQGIAWIGEKAGRFKKISLFLILLSVFYYPARTAWSHLTHPYEREEIRPLMHYLHANYQPTDALFLNNSAQYAFGYYNGLLSGFNKNMLLVGRLSQLIDSGHNHVGYKVAYMYHVYRESPPLFGMMVGNPPYTLLKKHLQFFQNNDRSWFVISSYDEALEQKIVRIFEQKRRAPNSFQKTDGSIIIFI